MQQTHGTFKGVRQSEIFYQCWLPDGAIQAVIVLVHGLAEHSGRYDNLVERFVPLGYAIYALDHIGHGRSAGDPVHVDSFDDYTSTLRTFVKMVASWQPDQRLFLVGHSMGGLIAVAYLMQWQEDFAGCVLSAPPIKVSDEVSGTTLTVGRWLSKIAPKFRLLQLDASAVSKDPAVVQAYIDDPLVYSGKMSARLGAEMIRTMQAAGQGAGVITLPILILQGDGDQLVDPAGAQMLYDTIGSDDKQLIVYPGLYHELFNEPERADVLDDMETWLANR